MLLSKLRIQLFERNFGIACLSVAFVMFLFSCKKGDSLRTPLESDKTKPGTVTDVRVNATPGGAKISYSLPEDPDILYIEANYQIREGVWMQAVSSPYADTMRVDGFRDTSEYAVDLYAVDRSGNRSEPFSIMVRPLLPPVLEAFKSLFYTEDFGGIIIDFRNEPRADLAISVIYRDEGGNWEDYERFYTNRPEAKLPVRGLPSQMTTFGVYLTDKWNNSSDTLVNELTPLFEEELEKSRFSVISPELPGDIPLNNGLWNGSSSHHATPFFSDPSAFPKRFSFDLGVQSKLSRFRIWGVHDGREFSGGNVKTFEVWGSNDPAANGSFDSWTLLDTYEIVKPSALPIGQLNNEDRAAAAEGMEFAVPIGAPAVKYIRVSIISTFASPPNAATGSTWVTEFSFWGQPDY